MRSRVSIFSFFLMLLVVLASAFGASGCRDLLAGFSAQPSELSESAIVIALGRDPQTAPLQNFANRMQGQLHRRVVTYRQFAEAHYIAQKGKWWESLPPDRVTAIVEQALRKAVSLHPGQRIIVFDLDGFDVSGLFDGAGQEVWSYTNFEVDLILRDRQLYSQTRWYRDRRELTSDQAQAFWQQTLAKLLAAPKPLKYAP